MNEQLQDMQLIFNLSTRNIHQIRKDTYSIKNIPIRSTVLHKRIEGYSTET